MDFLQWGFLARDQLTIESLRHALAVEPNDYDLDWDNFVDGKFLLDCCLGLIIIDESMSSIRLVHKSLQDYLQADYEKGVLFQKGHPEISHVCVTYLAFDSYDLEVNKLYPDILRKYAFLKYATLN
jgi:hypothetical protein